MYNGFFVSPSTFSEAPVLAVPMLVVPLTGWRSSRESPRSVRNCLEMAFLQRLPESTRADVVLSLTRMGR